MKRKIGVFETEQQVIDCIRTLQGAGLANGEMKVLVKDDEHSRRIERESGIHADEVQEIAETGREQDNVDLPLVAASPAGLGSSWNGSPALLGGYGFWGLDNDDSMMNAMQALGLGESEAEQCRGYLGSGAALVVVESEGSDTLFSQEGGPDPSKLGAAEALFRQCGALRIF